VRRSGIGVAVMFGLPTALLALAVVGGLTGNLWLVVAMIAAIWGLMTAAPVLSGRERRSTRVLAAILGAAGLALLATCVVLRDPQLYLSIASVIVFAGFVVGAIYAAISQAGQGREPPA